MHCHFFIPENSLPAAEELPFWLAGEPRQIEPPGKASTAQNWILLTFARLAKAGCPVRLCHAIPDEGVVFALTGSLPADFKAPAGVFLVGVVADGLPHPACHFHILQNAAHARRLRQACFIPHWPQPGLIPRDPGRGERFENLVFYGDPPNLASDLRDPGFAARMKRDFGVTFRIAENGCWHDYSAADAAIGIRAFGSKPFLRKPSTKLYNAWLAGVPFIGGADSALAADGRPGIDFLRCTDLQAVEKAVGQLRDSPALRRRLVSEGLATGKDFLEDRILARWKAILETLAHEKAPGFLSRPSPAKKFFKLTQWFAVRFDILTAR